MTLSFLELSQLSLGTSVHPPRAGNNTDRVLWFNFGYSAELLIATDFRQ